MDVRDHSIYFGDYNTWDEWHLVPSSRPTPSVPTVRTNYVNIPGRNGSLDMSEALTGYPLYDDRTIEGEFILYDQSLNWMDVYQDIMAKLHGKRMKIRLTDDMNYYYNGRVTVGDFASNSDFSSITISATVEPYKYNDTPLLYDEAELKIKDFTFPSGANKRFMWLQIGKQIDYRPLNEWEHNIGDVGTNGSTYFTKQTPIMVKNDNIYVPEIQIILSTHLLSNATVFNKIADYIISTNSTAGTFNVSKYGTAWASVMTPFTITPSMTGEEFRLQFEINLDSTTDLVTGATDEDSIHILMNWPDRRL